MLGLRIWQHCKYETIAQGAEYSRKTQEKPAGKHFGFFSPRYS